jgi:hypothetical protein
MAGVAKSANARDSKSRGSNPLRVQVPPPALPTRRKRGAVVTALLAILVAGCGLPPLPTLPEPGAPPLPVPWADADPAAVMAASAPLAVDGRTIEGGCLRRHLEEAIELNERRLPVYAEWSRGASTPISRSLIASERRGLLPARYVDRQARRYHAAGIPIVCAELVPMSLTPPLGTTSGPAPGYAVPPGPDPDTLLSLMRTAYGRGGFAGLADAVAAELARLDDAPAYHCMIRHLLESVARTAALAPLHDAAATAVGLPSTVPLSELMIRLHLAVLHESAELDAAASPLQAAGISIICRDVPPIPYPRGHH